MSPIAVGDLVVSPWRSRYPNVAHRVTADHRTETYRYRLACGYAMNDPRPVDLDAPAAPAPCRRCWPAGAGPLARALAAEPDALPGPEEPRR